MIYPDIDGTRFKELREQDPCGRRSNNEINEQILMEELEDAIQKAKITEELRDILETIVSLL